MKRLIGITIPILMVLAVIGCPGKQTDEGKIANLLAESQYTTEAVIDDSSSSPAPSFFSSSLADSIPYVRFVRKINRPITREVLAEVTGDSATATITAYLTGYFYADTALAVGPFAQRIIQDSTIRKVNLVRDSTAPYGWRIISLTPWQSHTIGANPIATITKVEATVASRGYTFTLTDAAAYLTKDQLPTFFPNDTIQVTVEVTTAGDSSWAFLHHGRRPHRIFHFKDPFLKESKDKFSGTWFVASDSVINTPRVRHAAFDIISWNSLWGPTTDSLYFSRVWALPYIVKKDSTETAPPDTTSATD
jgi:hypothetical protein